MNPWVLQRLHVCAESYRQIRFLAVDSSVLGARTKTTVYAVLAKAAALLKITIRLHNQLAVETAKELGQRLPGSLVTVILQNSLKATTIDQIICCLPAVRLLKILELHDFVFREPEISALAESLPQCLSLRELNIIVLVYVRCSLHRLWNVLPLCRNLTTLSLEGSAVQEIDLEHLIRVLPDCKALRTLRFINNPVLDDATATLLGSVLGQIPQLEVLNLSGCENILGKGIIALFRAVPACPRLHSMHTSNITPRNSQVDSAVYQAVIDSPHLEYLQYHSWTMSSKMDCEISYLLRQHRLLRKSRQSLGTLLLALGRHGRNHPRLPPELYTMIEDML